jgi:hypothetical protein
VERSDTHQCRLRDDGLSLRSTHPTVLRSFVFAPHST